jgi:type VI secretion system secreted protein Hcp
MAEDIFLKIKPIDGDCQVDGHKDELALYAWSWGVSQSGTMHENTGGGKGKSSFQDVTCSMKADKASATLLQHVATGKHITQKATLVQRKAGQKPIDFVKLEMEDIIITSFSISGSGEDSTVSFSINFSKYTFTFTPQDNKGNPGTPVPCSYDIAQVKE